MRVLTLRQPWAWAICYAGKDVENRGANVCGAYRGPVAIHAGKSIDIDAYMRFGEWVAEGRFGGADMTHFDTRGAVLGVVALEGSHGPHPAPACSPWAQPDAWHLELGEVLQTFHIPIPAKGMLGLWRPDRALGQALAQALA